MITINHHRKNLQTLKEMHWSYINEIKKVSDRHGGMKNLSIAMRKDESYIATVICRGSIKRCINCFDAIIKGGLLK